MSTLSASIEHPLQPGGNQVGMGEIDGTKPKKVDRAPKTIMKENLAQVYERGKEQSSLFLVLGSRFQLLTDGIKQQVASYYC